MLLTALLPNWRTARTFLGVMVRYRHLAWEMARRELTDRYAGQMLGAAWALAHPALLIAVYLFLFVYVLQIKLAERVDLPFDFSIYLLSGLIPWLAFSESMNKAVVTLIGHSNLVKQVVFPLEVLPFKGVLASCFPQAIGLALLMLYSLVRFQFLPWTYALLPLLLALQFLAMVGVASLLAALGAFFRDLKDFLQVFNVVGIYLMPVVFLPESVPAMLRPLLYLNPFSYFAWCFQDVCYFGRLEHPAAWVVFPLFAVTTFCAGYRVFNKLKPLYGNVL